MIYLIRDRKTREILAEGITSEGAAARLLRCLHGEGFVDAFIETDGEPSQSNEETRP